MTKQQHIKHRCWNCSKERKTVLLTCPKCGKSWPVGTPFGFWLRKQPELDSIKRGFDNQNLDYIWFAFKQGWFILIEEKMHDRPQDNNQNDTHSVVEQLLKSVPKGTKIDTYRGNREIEFRGYFLIQFEKTSPDDSKWIKINNEYHSKEDLLILLQSGNLINLESEVKKCKGSPFIEIPEKFDFVPISYITPFYKTGQNNK